MAEQAGTLVGHYRLLSTIGSGGFSTVYRAVDERLDAEVAVKVLAENHALDPEVRERFVAEAQLLRRIECPAVIAVHDVGETARSQPYIVMSHADRGDLGTRAADLWVRLQHQVSAEEALQVAATLAVGLGRAHRAGLVHRDVKPANLLLATDPSGAPTAKGSATPALPAALIGADERLVLSDLGFGKDLLASSGLTVGGGTVGFAAPEQRAPHATVDPRADIHAASAVLHWLFARRTPPESGEGRADDERLPDALVPVLRRGLATDPGHRHDDIDEWFDEVTAALTPAPTTPRSLPPSEAITPATAPTATAGPDPLGARPGSAARHDIDHEQAERRSAAPLVALVVGVLIGLAVAGAVLALGLVGGDGTTEAVADDGTLTVAAERDGLTLSVSGPQTVALGDQIELTATATGHRTIHWFAAVGGTDEGERLTLDTGRVGVAVVTATAVDDVGRTVTVEFPVTVE